MPQMAPMPWIILLMFTLTSLVTISSLIYFTNQCPMKNSSFKTNSKFNWKW